MAVVSKENEAEVTQARELGKAFWLSSPLQLLFQAYINLPAVPPVNDEWDQV